MTRTLPSSELRNHLAEALRSAEAGEPVMITRYGKPAAALIAAEQLVRQEQSPSVAGEPVAVAEPAGGGAGAVAEPATAEPTPRQLLERAAAASLRRIELDHERLPEKLKPILGMIRKNLFHPRLTVQRIQRVLGIGGNDLTTRFRDVAGAPIREYLEDRRLECASRLLVDTELDVRTIALLVGYRSREVFARAFGRRLGVRPLVYREFDGRLSRQAVAGAVPGRAPIAPRYLAGEAVLAPDTLCPRCGTALEPAASVRVFEDLAPICDPCARQRAPVLAALLEANAGG